MCGPENERPGFCNSEKMTVLRFHSIGTMRTIKILNSPTKDDLPSGAVP